MDVSDGIAAAAFAVSLAAFGLSAWIGVRQHRLNGLLVARETAEARRASTADFAAEFVKTGKHHWRYQITNVGSAMAHEVCLEPLEGEALLDPGELKRKLPFPSLDCGGVIQIMARVYMTSPRRLVARLSWHDDSGEQEKTITTDVF